MPRRHSLVCQYVENLSSAAIEKYADIIRDLVGRQHGVYALYKRERLYYVGLATNLRSRLRHHLKDRHNGRWDRFSVYLTIDSRHMKELESLVLRIVRPKGNRQIGKFARSDNLLPVLKRRFRQQQKEELLDLIGRSYDLVTTETAPRKRRGKAKRGDGPVLAGYVSKAKTLRVTYKGVVHKARVRKDGTIRVGAKVFNSPSTAGAHVAGRPVNGWTFWKYERAPGKWVGLADLRRR